MTAGGRPVAGVNVNSTPRHDGSVSGSTVTRFDGYYGFKGLDEEEYVIRVRGHVFELALVGDTTMDLALAPDALAGTVETDVIVANTWGVASSTSVEGSRRAIHGLCLATRAPRCFAHDLLGIGGRESQTATSPCQAP